LVGDDDRWLQIRRCSTAKRVTMADPAAAHFTPDDPETGFDYTPSR